MAAGEKTEVLVLANERETLADGTRDQLRSAGFLVGQPLSVGADIERSERARLEAASAVVVLLGSEGWSVGQKALARQAVELGKRIFPGLIGRPSEEALADVDGLFLYRQRVDLMDGQPAFDQLTSALRTLADDDVLVSRGQGDRRFDEVINTFVDGNEADRAALLQRIIRLDGDSQRALGERIRDSIRRDFAPEQQENFATAIRDPMRISSTRSWMLSGLIWIDPLHDDSRSLILKHLDENREPDRNVRFWTLAGVLQRDLSYGKIALDQTRRDSEPEVAGLSAIAADPTDADQIERFRNALRSPDFEIAWSVLRILRVFAIPELTVDVVEQLEREASGKLLTYDVLYALASPKMASAARSVLSERPGLPRLVELILREARNSTRGARSTFARLLSVFEVGEVRSALRKSAAPGDGALIAQLLEGAPGRDEDIDQAPLMAGYAPDTVDISADDIGIRRDVETLASVMLARQVTPPLAIGLFGEWGSGKSFFMKSIAATAKRIAQTAKDSGDTSFCTDIVQVEFNAWHYVDTSLWASLVSHLLEGLSSHLSPNEDPAASQAKLAEELTSVKVEMTVATAARDKAADQLRQSSEALEKLVLARERSELRLRDVRASDLLDLLSSDPGLATQIEGALRDVGAPAALGSIDELNLVVEESYSIGGQLLALLSSILKGRNALIMVIGIALLLVAPPIVAWLIETVVTPNAAWLSAFATQIAVVVGSVSLVLRGALTQAKAALDVLSNAKRDVDKKLAARRETPTQAEKALEQELATARGEEAAASERVAATTARAKVLEDQLFEIQRSRTLGYFVAERMRTDDYRRHQGLMSVVRRDFDGLVQRLKDGQAAGTARIDRIVLYIDDLDRCPPNVVLDVLQAVHLLLAYELFVVVVSVEPQWLLRSLESKFEHLKKEDAAASGATAQDYLEKIFQVPFTVRPMTERAFGRMMQRLLAPGEREPERSHVEVPSNSAASDQGNTRLTSRDGHTDQQATTATWGKAEAAQEVSRERLESLARAIDISAVEVEFSERLHRLLGTPRSAKRFANVYRLFKASVLSVELDQFEGTAAVPGDFQLPMLLLAAVIGEPAAAAVLFPLYRSRALAADRSWWNSFADQEYKDAERLQREVAALLESAQFPTDASALLEWLPRVARYSFLTGGMFLADR